MKLAAMLRSCVFLLFAALSSADSNHSSNCRADDFPCNNGFCLEKQKWCDGKVDCTDDSDERYCFLALSKNLQKCDEALACQGGRCVPPVGRYDYYDSYWYNFEDRCGSTAETENAEVVEKTNSMKTAEVQAKADARTAEVSDQDYLRNFVQVDSISPKHDIFMRGFVELDARDFQSIRENARKWLLSIRDKDYGWKEETARALTALYMSDDLHPNQYEDNELMSTQLHLKLFTTWIKNRTSPVPLAELSLLINALSASCHNPRNFYGIDLIEILRHRTDIALETAAFLNPIVYITLCLNDAIVYSDIPKIKEIYGVSKLNRIAIEALASLATTCISRMSEFKYYSTELQTARLLYHKISRQGLPENIYELSLVSQALNEAHINQDLWNRTKAIDIILNQQESDGSFGDMLATYYTMPLLSGKSLLSLGQHCGTSASNGSTAETENAEVVEKANSVNEAAEVSSTADATTEVSDQDYLQNVVQVDSISHKDDGFEKGFTELDARDFQSIRENARKWLLSIRDKDYGWKEETARALTALSMSDDLLPNQYEDNMLMSTQLHFKLFSTLIRNRTSPVPLSELSLFINALSASCDSPRNFYGIDLIEILRHRTNVAQRSATFLSPIVYITLCLNDAILYSDILKFKDVYVASKMNRIDIEALASLAATCISRISEFSNYSTELQTARRLYHKISRQGLPENIYQLSLVSQALNEAHINQDLWNRTKAIDKILDHQESDGSFGDMLATYYTMPLLSGKSLLSLGQHCGTSASNGSAPFVALKNEEDKIKVRYSLYFGNTVDASQTMTMKVNKSTNFLDLMRVSETINPVYKFKYGKIGGIPSVYSIGGVVNDPENGLYWKLYVTSRQNSTDQSNWIPYEGDMRRLIPEAEDSIVFWRKSLNSF